MNRKDAGPNESKGEKFNAMFKGNDHALSTDFFNDVIRLLEAKEREVVRTRELYRHDRREEDRAALSGALAAIDAERCTETFCD